MKDGLPDRVMKNRPPSAEELQDLLVRYGGDAEMLFKEHFLASIHFTRPLILEFFYKDVR